MVFGKGDRLLLGAKTTALDLEREPRAVSAVLQIVLRVIKDHLRNNIPTASPQQARLGAVGFVHRFDSALNRHFHFTAASSTACSIPAKMARSAASTP
jgi:hypothetical protein